jgi:hypothetical protein
MPWFEGSHTETFTVPADLASTKAHFADVDTIAANTEHLASHSVDGDVVHFVLEEQNHQVVVFTGDYKCRYVLDGDTLVWTSEGGNTDQSGQATFRAVDGGTEVAYSETVKVDLDVNAMMAPMLKPLMGPMIGHEIKEYLKRMRKALA